MTTQDLDNLFGIVSVPFDNVTMQLRRVLTRAQSRTVADVLTNSSKIQVAIAAMDFDALDENQAAEVARKMEDDICADLVRGCSACIVNHDELGLDEWSVVSLTQLFNFLREQTAKTLTDAMRSTFPQNGSNG